PLLGGGKTTLVYDQSHLPQIINNRTQCIIRTRPCQASAQGRNKEKMRRFGDGLVGPEKHSIHHHQNIPALTSVKCEDLALFKQCPGKQISEIALRQNETLCFAFTNLADGVLCMKRHDHIEASPG